MEASEPKRVNPLLNIIGVNSLRLGGLQMEYCKTKLKTSNEIILYLCYFSFQTSKYYTKLNKNSQLTDNI